MGDDAVILEGVDSEASRDSLYSTVHGAGRVMSRTAAKGKFVQEDGKRIRKPGLVRHDEMMKWLHERGVTLRGGDLDEAPQAISLTGRAGGACRHDPRNALRPVAWPWLKITTCATHTRIDDRACVLARRRAPSHLASGSDHAMRNRAAATAREVFFLSASLGKELRDHLNGV